MRRAIRLLILVALAAPLSLAYSQAPATVTITGNIYGAPVTVSVTPTWAFVTADGYYLAPQVYTVTASTSSGSLSIPLPSNSQSTPSGSSYVATYSSPTRTWTEEWIVPPGSTATLAQVRVFQPPANTFSFGVNQLIAPTPCSSTQALTWNGGQWTCAAAGSVYPGAGVANSTGTAWGTSYTVGSAANDLPQLNGSAQLLPSELPAPTASTLGGVESAAAVAHEWINSYSTAGVPGLSQPNFTDLAGTIASAQLGVVPLANGGTGAASLTAANIPVQSGTITTGDCVKWASGTSITDAGAACGSGGGGATLQTNGANNASQTTLNLQSGTFVSETNASLGNVKADLSASGTPSSTTFLRGDNTWATPSATAGVSSLQWDALGPFTGALDIASGAGLVTQGGTAPVNMQVAVQQASTTLFGGVMLGGDLAGSYNSQQVVAVHPSIANDTTTGTTINTLAKIIANGSAAAAVITATTDTTGAIGIVTGGAGKTGSAQIATQGIALCQFDATAINVGDWVQISSTTAGDCHDAGATKPASGEIVGHAVTGGAASTAQSVLVEVSW